MSRSTIRKRNRMSRTLSMELAHRPMPTVQLFTNLEMSEIVRDTQTSFKPEASIIPYETRQDDSINSSIMNQTLDDSVFDEPDTEENLKTAYARSGKRFEFGTGISNIRSDIFEVKPVSVNPTIKEANDLSSTNAFNKYETNIKLTNAELDCYNEKVIASFVRQTI